MTTQFIIHGVPVDCPEKTDAKVGAWFKANFPNTVDGVEEEVDRDAE